jgi:hypothetical protein
MSVLMKRWIYLFLALCSCRAENLVKEDNIFIFATWEVGRKPTIQALVFENSSSIVADNEQFQLLFPDGEIASFILNGEVYELQSSRNLVAGEQLELKWFREGIIATARVEMPPVLENVIVQRDTLNSALNETSYIQWDIVADGYEFASQLNCLEEQPVMLSGTPVDFSANHGSPQVSPNIELSVDDFSYFGTHELMITVLNEAMVDVFFFDPSDIRGLVKNGPDNVEGGNGLISTISSHRIILEVE